MLPRTHPIEPPSARSAAVDPRRVAFFLVVALAIGATAYVAAPLVVPLVLALWIAHLVRPAHARVSNWLGGRARGAALATALAVLAVLAPIALAIVALVPAAKSLFEQVGRAGGGRSALAALVSGGAKSVSLDPRQAWQSLAQDGGPFTFVKEHGAAAAGTAMSVLGSSANALVATLVFFVAFHATLVRGDDARTWLEVHAPLPKDVFARLCDAFYQAGRGLLVGNGLTALVQGALATVLYAVLGVPRAVLLGLLTFVAALVPAGPALVWIPIALGLVLTGHPGKAGILAVLGIFVIGTIDNLLRPWLSKRAEIGLPSSVLLVSMLGGIAALGAWGLLLGPLVVRLAKELLVLAHERRWLVSR